MNEEAIKAIQEMPKAILHIHLDGSLRPETVYKWLKEQGKEVTLEEVKEKLMVDRECRDLNQYLEKFDLPVSLLQTEEHIEQATYELFIDLASQNDIYAEVRFAPSLHTNQGLTYSQIVEAAIRGMDRAKKDCKIEGNLILCCMRGKDNKESNLETINIARKYVGKGVVSLDLAGAEAVFPTKDFEDIFRMAKKLDIPFTIHAGEADGVESIKKAIEFGACRIGHGVRCLEDESLVQELIQNGIALEICPISNLQTKATGEPHPIEEIYRKGINTTINTDNNTVSNTNLIEEYKYILQNTNLNMQDIIQMNTNAIRAAFISQERKEKLIEHLNKYKDRISKFD